MKKKILSVFLTAALVGSTLAGCAGSSGGSSQSASSGSVASGSTSDISSVDFSGKDPKLTKKIKILSIWAEDNDNGVILNKICDNYKKEVNPNFSWDYEMVSSDSLNQKIATLAASNDLPDVFAYESGALLKTLVDSNKVVDISKAVDKIGCGKSLDSVAVALLKNLSGTPDLYDLPLGMNVEGFWYNKALFKKAGCSVPTTWDEFDGVLAKLKSAGITPLTTGGADKWPATRLVNAYAVRSMGNDIMTKAANGKTKYTDAGFVKAANKISEWAKKGYFGKGINTVDSNTAGSMLMNGKAAIYYNGSWFTQNLSDKSQNPAGDNGIGFFNVPVVDKSVSPITSYSMNCGNILCLDKSKFDQGTAWFLKYFIENMGNLAMTQVHSVKGYTYTVGTKDMNAYTKLTLDELAKAREGFAWWEAKMPADVAKPAKDNVQNLLNGDMTGEAYMKSIQDAYDMNKK